MRLHHRGLYGLLRQSLCGYITEPGAGYINKVFEDYIVYSDGFKVEITMAGDDDNDQQFAKDARGTLQDLASTEAGRKLLLEQAAALSDNNPVAGPSQVDVEALVKGITEAMTASFKAQAAMVAEATKKKKREPEADEEVQGKRLKEDPIPSPFSRAFGKGGFTKDEDVLFSNEGNAIHYENVVAMWYDSGFFYVMQVDSLGLYTDRNLS